jgi:hypothetical protein
MEATREAKKGQGGKKKVLEAGTPIDEALVAIEIAVDAHLDLEEEDEYEYEEGCVEEGPADEEWVYDDPSDAEAGNGWGPGFVGFSYAATQYGGDALAYSRSFILRFGLTEPHSADRLHAGMEFAFSPIHFDPGYAAGLDGGLEVSLGGDVRYDLTPAHTFAGVQLIGGFRAGILRWDYASPVWIEDEYGDLEAHSSDRIYTWTPYGGIGLAFVRSGGFRLGTSLIAGMTLFDEYTSSGLLNDLFDLTPQVQLRFHLTQHF